MKKNQCTNDEDKIIEEVTEETHLDEESNVNMTYGTSFNYSDKARLANDDYIR